MLVDFPDLPILLNNIKFHNRPPLPTPPTSIIDQSTDTMNQHNPSAMYAFMLANQHRNTLLNTDQSNANNTNNINPVALDFNAQYLAPLMASLAAATPPRHNSQQQQQQQQQLAMQQLMMQSAMQQLMMRPNSNTAAMFGGVDAAQDLWQQHLAAAFSSAYNLNHYQPPSQQPPQQQQQQQGLNNNSNNNNTKSKASSSSGISSTSSTPGPQLSTETNSVKKELLDNSSNHIGSNGSSIEDLSLNSSTSKSSSVAKNKVSNMNNANAQFVDALAAAALLIQNSQPNHKQPTNQQTQFNHQTNFVSPKETLKTKQFKMAKDAKQQNKRKSDISNIINSTINTINTNNNNNNINNNINNNNSEHLQQHQQLSDIIAKQLLNNNINNIKFESGEVVLASSKKQDKSGRKSLPNPKPSSFVKKELKKETSESLNPNKINNMIWIKNFSKTSRTSKFSYDNHF